MTATTSLAASPPRHRSTVAPPTAGPVGAARDGAAEMPDSPRRVAGHPVDQAGEQLADRPGQMTGPPTVDVVVPVYNEEAVLAASVERLHALPGHAVPVHVAHHHRRQRLDRRHRGHRARPGRAPGRGVRFVHLDRKGRGLALRTAWTGSDAAVVAYMDVDLSTDLDALLPLVAPLVSGHSRPRHRLPAGARLAASPAARSASSSRAPTT